MKKADLIDLINRNFGDDDEINFYVYDYEYASGEDDYKDVINEHVNNDIINYYGFQSDVKPYINKCHCFILPSYHEGMANTLLEAASISIISVVSLLFICVQLTHKLQGVMPFRFSQLTVFPIILAIVVLPVPLGPANK